jgi:glycosyltransferase involved in cell wall biosynthesis
VFDFEVMLRRSLQVVGQNDVAVAMPYDLPDRVCRDLIAEGLARSIVADHAAAATLDDTCAGWWVDRPSGRLHLRLRRAKNLLIAGVHGDRRLHPGLLLEARLKGVQRIVSTDAAGNLIEDMDPASALHDCLDAMYTAPRVSDVSYEAAFDALYRLIGDRLRLPRRAFSPVRVALCLGSLGPGGAERQGAYTAAGAQRNGFEACIICNHVAPPADFFRPYVESRGARVVQVPDTPPELDEDQTMRGIQAQMEEQFPSLGMSNIFIEILRYASVLRAMRPGLVHGWMDYSNVLCGTAAQLVGVPGLVLSCRSLAPSHFRIFQPYMRPGYKTLLQRRSALLLNNSQAGAADYASWLDIEPSRIGVVHNGFEFPPAAGPEVRSRVRREHGIAENDRVVGSILRFSEEKRPRLLVDMAAAMLARDPALRFLFFGGGVLLDTTRAYVEQLGLGNAILLPGLTNAAWDVLSAMDLFALTSRMEGLPNVLVEAQASGLPIVCTGVGGMPETFLEGETGVAVPEATAEALAQAALALLDDPERLRGMSARAAAHARQEFGLAHMIEATIKTYENALSTDSAWRQAKKTA